MRVRAPALAAAVVLLAKCLPSGDLASYSSGLDEAGGAEPGTLPGENAGFGGSGAGAEPTGAAQPDDTATGGGEGGITPGGLQGGDGSSAAGATSGTGGTSTSVAPDTDPTDLPDQPAEFRFVRLVADSDLSSGPLTSVAEFNVLDAEGSPIDRSGWSITADSEESVYVGGAQAGYAIDGLSATMWHTPWFEVDPPPHPHFIEVDMGESHAVAGFRYLPRQDGSVDGSIAAYRLFVSSDGVEWGEPVASGTFPSGAVEQEVRFAPASDE